MHYITLPQSCKEIDLKGKEAVEFEKEAFECQAAVKETEYLEAKKAAERLATEKAAERHPELRMLEMQTQNNGISNSPVIIDQRQKLPKYPIRG